MASSSTPATLPWHHRVRALCSLLAQDDQQALCRQIDHILLGHWLRPTSLSLSIRPLVIQLSDFTLLGRIGQGQFGKVCIADSVRLLTLQVDASRCHIDGRVYAIKTVDKHIAARAPIDIHLERRIHLAATDHAPALFASFQSSSSLYLVVEYASCGSLWDHIATQSEHTIVLSAEETLYWTSQMVAAIGWLHQLGYAHRDVKPQNVLLFPDKRLKLTDFGSAAPLLEDDTVDPSFCNFPIGTPDYIAPEILHRAEQLLLTDNAASYTKSVDWWSLGATVFELSTGAPPFYAPSIATTYSKIVRAEYTIQAVPDSVKEVVAR